MFLVILFCASLLSNAQRVYFIYLQTEDASPFFVKMENKVYSSNYAGYLIFSSLKDSTYSFSVGPVAKGIKEPQFSVVINGADKGYLIKSFKEYTGLFDLQTLSILKPTNIETKATGQVNLVPRTDAFSVMLAMSANDSSLLYTQAKTEVPKATEEKKEIVKTEVVDSLQKNAVVAGPISTSTEETQKEIAIVKPEEKKDSVIDQQIIKADTVVQVAETQIEEYKKSTVVKHSESSTTEGFGLVFWDKKGDAADTIRLLIPNPKVVFEETKEEVASIIPEQKPVDTIARTQLIEEKKEVKADSVITEIKITADSTLSNVKADSLAEVKVKVAEKPVQTTACKSSASDNDFFKLRKNMAAKDGDEDMIMEARRTFKKYCFTTEQIRNLSALFLTPGGKYQFFDAAYTHVSDPQNFSTLEAEIKDDYNLKRFKALLGE
jgi:hypothetical protein